jgi:hypothetical protein
MHWNNGIHWDITFSKAFHDWELEILTSFLDLIYSIKIKGNGEDRMCWMPTRSSMFEVKSFYRVLQDGNTSTFPWKCIWRVKDKSSCFLLESQLDGEERRWKMRFHRYFYDWELEPVHSFLDLLHSNIHRKEGCEMEIEREW